MFSIVFSEFSEIYQFQQYPDQGLFAPPWPVSGSLRSDGLQSVRQRHDPIPSLLRGHPDVGQGGRGQPGHFDLHQGRLR